MSQISTTTGESIKKLRNDLDFLRRELLGVEMNRETKDALLRTIKGMEDEMVTLEISLIPEMAEEAA